MLPPTSLDTPPIRQARALVPLAAQLEAQHAVRPQEKARVVDAWRVALYAEQADVRAGRLDVREEGRREEVCEGEV